MQNIYNTIIVGAGPAGVAAGIYCARKKLKTLLVTQDFGGQSKLSDSIENWVGEIKISGIELARKLERHLRFYEQQQDLQVKDQSRVVVVKKQDDFFKVGIGASDDHNQSVAQKFYYTKTMIVTSGGRHRQLNVPGEDKFNGKGVAYCSTCDAPMFKDKKVAVVGSGNSGLEAVLDLIPYASKIYLMDVLSEIKGDAVLRDKINQSNQVTFMPQTRITEIFGDQFVKGVKYQDKNNQEKTLEVGGVFVEIGMVPNSEFIKGVVELNDYGQIKIDFKTQATSQEGIWAAGDVTDTPFKQNNIAAGDGVVAALAVYDFLNKK